MTTLIIIIIAIITYWVSLKKLFTKKLFGQLQISNNMIIAIVALTLTLVATMVYFVIILDKQLYYYGKNNWNIHDKLPFKLTPQFLDYDRGNYGFELESEDGLVGIGQGAKYWTSNVEVNEIIKYGFNKEKMVGLVNDSLGKQYYVVFEKNLDIYSKKELVVTVIPKNSFINTTSLKWIDIKNVSTEQTERMRNSLEIFSILLLLFVIVYFIEKRKNFPIKFNAGM